MALQLVSALERRWGRAGRPVKRSQNGEKWADTSGPGTRVKEHSQEEVGLGWGEAHLDQLYIQKGPAWTGA